MDQQELPGGYDRSGKGPKIKNKNAAPVQITAEQLLREAQERREKIFKPPEQKMMDGEELSEYRLRKRKEFEDGIRKNRLNVGNWLKYAKWEEANGFLDRARSIYERALDVDSRNATIYLKYVEMEMKHKNINLARNLFDRIVTILPRNNLFWQRYSYMEEIVGNVLGARQIFERWMKWEPDETAWKAYVKFEQRYGEQHYAEMVMERFVDLYPEPKNWIAWAKFVVNDNDKVREIYGKAIDYIISVYNHSINNKVEVENEKSVVLVFVEFAKFENRLKETERARAIYKYAIELFPKSTLLYKQYTVFEKQNGSIENIEHVVLMKRRKEYTKVITENPNDYLTWVSLLLLEQEIAKIQESESEAEAGAGAGAELTSESGDGQEGRENVRNMFERAISNKPSKRDEKGKWKEYVYIWLLYAVYEETEAKNIQRARKVYERLIDEENIPHKKFTFGKIWIQYAMFEVRQLDIDKARKILGLAMGKYGRVNGGKQKIYRGYIELEMMLREFDRVRMIYNKFIEAFPSSSIVWVEYARMEELMLGEIERARMIYELAIKSMTPSQGNVNVNVNDANDDNNIDNDNDKESQQIGIVEMDMPEIIYKSYIDFEQGNGNYKRVKLLYERLLEKSQHVKIWLSFGAFLTSIIEWNNSQNQDQNQDQNQNQSELEQQVENVRQLYNRAYSHFKLLNQPHERILIVEAMKRFESSIPPDSNIASKLEEINLNYVPEKVVKRRKVTTTTNTFNNNQQKQFGKGQGEGEGKEGEEEEEEEEYIDYIFPDDYKQTGTGMDNKSGTGDKESSGFKLLEMAKKWKAKNK